MPCGEAVAALFQKSRKVVSYVEVYPTFARDAIAAYLRENVPALGSASFCPEGRSYNAHQMYHPVEELVLGEPRYNGDRVVIDEGWYHTAKTYPKPDDLAYDEQTDTWILQVHTTWWTDGVGSARRMCTDAVGVSIPGSVMSELFSLVLGGHAKVSVVWSW